MIPEQRDCIIQTEKTVIASGSVPTSLPGIEIDEKVIVSSTGALKLNKVPKKMVVVGGGYIGLEMGSVWSRLGAEVQVIEFLDHITPGMDKEISSEFMKILKKQGIKFNMQNKVETIQRMINQEQLFQLLTKMEIKIILIAMLCLFQLDENQTQMI